MSTIINFSRIFTVMAYDGFEWTLKNILNEMISIWFQPLFIKKYLKNAITDGPLDVTVADGDENINLE